MTAIMTDRELLELAAKAAGIGPLDFDYAKHEGHEFYWGPRLPMPQGVLMAAMHTYWNPIDDNGDAFRLAVKLKLHLYPGDDDIDVVPLDDNWCSTELFDFHNGDECAAWRLAITRAAAYIGKAMP
jgi:hypothetical protein